jgi:hypothetical protein
MTSVESCEDKIRQIPVEFHCEFGMPMKMDFCVIDVLLKDGRVINGIPVTQSGALWQDISPNSNLPNPTFGPSDIVIVRKSRSLVKRIFGIWT